MALCEITGTVTFEKFRKDGFAIIEILVDGTPTTVKGDTPAEDLRPGLEYRFFGHHTEHIKYGRGFAFQTYILTEPHARNAVIRYLQLAPYVGTATACKLWTAFREEAVKVLRENPAAASAAIGARFPEYRAIQASEKLAAMAALEDTTIDLMGLFEHRKFPKDTPNKAIALWSLHAAKRIRQNPYLLMQIKGIGFLAADAMYIDLGFNPNKLKRQ